MTLQMAERTVNFNILHKYTYVTQYIITHTLDNSFTII